MKGDVSSQRKIQENRVNTDNVGDMDVRKCHNEISDLTQGMCANKKGVTPNFLIFFFKKLKSIIKSFCTE